MRKVAAVKACSSPAEILIHVSIPYSAAASFQANIIKPHSTLRTQPQR